MKKVSFRESSNIIVTDSLTMNERKELWYTRLELKQNFKMIHQSPEEEVYTLLLNKDRKQRIRNFIQFIVGEYKSMASYDSIGLYHMSLACTKIDRARALERANIGKATVIKSTPFSSSSLRHHYSLRNQSSSHGRYSTGKNLYKP